MKLNDISKKPFKIITYFLITFIASYLTTMSFNVAFITTLIAIWICMMPRLKFEEYTFKDKIPKFIIKTDLPNNIIRTIPIILGFKFCLEQSAITTLTNTILPPFIIFLIPIILGCIHYFIYNKYKQEQDWAMPLLVSFVIVLLCQVIIGDIGEFCKALFPSFVEGATPQIFVAWLTLLQTALVYAIYRLLSIIIASRSFCMIVLGLFTSLFAYLQTLYSSTIYLDFKPNDIVRIKEFIALCKIMITDNFDTTKLILTAGSIIIIGILSSALSKNSSVYKFKTRAKSFLCGGIVVIFCFTMFNTIYKDVDFYKYKTEQGFVSYIVHNLNQKNTFSKDLQKKINEEIVAMEAAQAEKETAENTQSADEHADFTVPNNTQQQQQEEVPVGKNPYEDWGNFQEN